MPRLSIIIRVLGSADGLETTLVSVLEKRPADCEIIVLLAAPYDDPYDLAGEVQFVRMADSSNLAASINRGVEISRGEIVHLLSSGFEVAEAWTDAALEHFHDTRVASVAPLVVNALDMHTTIAAGLDYSCRLGRVVRTSAPAKNDSTAQQESVDAEAILGPLLHASFYRRSIWELVGGLSCGVGDALADVDLALSLRFAGYRSVLEPRSVVWAMPSDIAAPPPGFRTGLAEERLFWRAAPTVGWGKSLAAHPLGVLGDFAKTLPRPAAFTALFGRFVGVCQMRQHRAHYRWLGDLGQNAAAAFRGQRSARLRIDRPHEARSSTSANIERASPETSIQL